MESSQNGDMLNESSKFEEKNISIVEEKKTESEIPKKTLYLGLLVKEPIEKIYEILISSLKTILELYPNISDGKYLLKLLEEKTLEKEENYKSPWSYPKDYKKWHITTLFKKGPSLRKSHPAYLSFEQGKLISTEIRGIVYIPNKIITSIIP
jgi:hypothetical protein